jgi:hypothetical protein
MAGFHDPSTPTSTRSSVSTTHNDAASPSSHLSHFAQSIEIERCQNETNSSGDSRDDFRRMLAVSKLQTGLQEMKATLEKLRASREESRTETRTTTHDRADDVLREKMTLFVENAKMQVSAVQSNLELVLAIVKDISVYFNGEADTAKNLQPSLHKREY